VSALAGAPSFGRPHLHLRLTDSTNERARELAAAGAGSGTVVTADEQHAGRGRRGRRWSAPAGKALLYSAILRPLTEAHLLLPLAVPLAVCDAIEDVSSHECRIKWPNDVWITEKKVSGVLIEARPPQWAVIGVGVNVSIGEEEFPAELRWPATSIGDGVEVDGVAVALNERLEGWVEAPLDDVLAAFRERDALKGREVWWRDAAPRESEPSSPEDADGSGVADGIDDRGNLLVLMDSGEHRSLGAGEVQLSLG
jgi:BirA family biotin operon repressor/biotin-[acetyl-CoA-carboxylase] ligase